MDAGSSGGSGVVTAPSLAPGLLKVANLVINAASTRPATDIM